MVKRGRRDQERDRREAADIRREGRAEKGKKKKRRRKRQRRADRTLES